MWPASLQQFWLTDWNDILFDDTTAAWCPCGMMLSVACPCRPVILPDYAELDLRIPGDARCPAWVCFDGKQRQELARGDTGAHVRPRRPQCTFLTVTAVILCPVFGGLAWVGDDAALQLSFCQHFLASLKAISDECKCRLIKALAACLAVRVRMSTNPVPTISKTDQTDDWFGSLERCFAWNDRMEQKPC